MCLFTRESWQSALRLIEGEIYSPFPRVPEASIFCHRINFCILYNEIMAPWRYREELDYPVSLSQHNILIYYLIFV